MRDANMENMKRHALPAAYTHFSPHVLLQVPSLNSFYCLGKRYLCGF